MKEPVKTLRDTDDEARALARKLVRASRFGAVAVLEPGTGFPFASRVLTGTDCDGVPVTLVSALSTHTAAIAADPRCSLLFGEPGKGDPLAHSRITLRCHAAQVPRSGQDHARIRARFLARHPKAQLYVDFPDFAFFRMVPESASLNGGFGRAYALEGGDLIMASPAVFELAAMEQDAIAHMNSDHGEAADAYAAAFLNQKTTGWKICGIDTEGIDLLNADQLARFEYERPIETATALRRMLSELLSRARKTLEHANPSDPD